MFNLVRSLNFPQEGHGRKIGIRRPRLLWKIVKKKENGIVVVNLIKGIFLRPQIFESEKKDKSSNK